MAPPTIAEPVILDKALISHKVENFSPKKPAPKPQIVCSVKPTFEFSKAVLLDDVSGDVWGLSQLGRVLHFLAHDMYKVDLHGSMWMGCVQSYSVALFE